MHTDKVEHLGLAESVQGDLYTAQAQTSPVDEVTDNEERIAVAQQVWNNEGVVLLQPRVGEAPATALQRQVQACRNIEVNSSPRLGLTERGNVPSPQHAPSKRTAQGKRQRVVAMRQCHAEPDGVAAFVMRRSDLPMLSDEEYNRLVSKSVLFVRHAESAYQADQRDFQAKCADKALLDAELTPLGRKQAAALGCVLAQQRTGRALNGQNGYDLLVSSPLSRCMQTAALAFNWRSDRDITVLHALTEKVDSYSDVSRPLPQRLALHKELQVRATLCDRVKLRRCNVCA